MALSLLISVAPMLVLLLLMTAGRMSAAKAGVAALFLAAAGAVWMLLDRPEISTPYLLGGAMLEAGFIATTILWIIFPALCIYHLQRLTGAFPVILETLGRHAPNPLLRVFLIGWFFSLFMEGAAGFGTPVALAAPMLVASGVSPVPAVAIAAIGHALGTSFGAVGTPIIPLVAATGLASQSISQASSVFPAVFGVVMTLFIARLFPSQLKNRWAWAIAAAVAFIAPQFMIAWFVGPELPTLAGALIGATVFIGLMRLYYGSQPSREAAEPHTSSAHLWRAGMPYLLVIALIVTSRLVPWMTEALKSVQWTWALGPFSGNVFPWFHPGTLMMVAFLASWVILRPSGHLVGGAVLESARTIAKVAVPVVAMLGLARIMLHAGMIDTLATAAAIGPTHDVWPLLAPAVGVLGAFVTGSATASNILFMDLHTKISADSGLSTTLVAAAQNTGAAAGNLIAPHNIVAGCATVGLVGKEGEVLKRTLGPCLIYMAGAGLFALMLSKFGVF